MIPKSERLRYPDRNPRADDFDPIGAFDPKFETMTCKTCHGDGAENGSWEMPNPKIKALPGSEEAFMASVQKEPAEGKWGGFMATQLEPAMGKLLGVQVFDPKTKTGEFSCEN